MDAAISWRRASSSAEPAPYNSGSTRIAPRPSEGSRPSSVSRASAAGLGDRVRFLGAMPYEDVPRILHECDVFATASESEMYPLVVVEACAAGLPVLGVESPGVGEIITSGASGLLCQPNPQEFADQILRAASDATLMARLRAGAAEVASSHDIAPSSARLIETYEDLIATGE